MSKRARARSSCGCAAAPAAGCPTAGLTCVAALLSIRYAPRLNFLISRGVFQVHA